MRIIFFALLLLLLSLAIWYIASVQNWSMKVDESTNKSLPERSYNDYQIPKSGQDKG